MAQRGGGGDKKLGTRMRERERKGDDVAAEKKLREERGEIICGSRGGGGKKKINLSSAAVSTLDGATETIMAPMMTSLTLSRYRNLFLSHPILS